MGYQLGLLQTTYYGATLAQHLIQTEYRVSSLSKVWQTLSNFCRTKLKLPYQIDSDTALLPYPNHQLGSAHDSRLSFLSVLPWNEDNSLWLGASLDFSSSLPTISWSSVPKSSQCFLCGRRFLQTRNHIKGWIVCVVSTHTQTGYYWSEVK